MLYGPSPSQSELGVFLGTMTISNGYGHTDTYNTFWNAVVVGKSTTYPPRDLLRRVEIPGESS